LRNQCGEPAADSSWGLSSLAPGTYTIVVAAATSADEGPVTLNFTLTPPAPGDTCADAIDLAISPDGGTADVTGTTAGLFQNYPGCGGSTQPDVVYQFTLGRQLSVFASDTSPDGGVPHSLELKPADCTAADLACEYDFAAGTRAVMRAPDLPAGTYELILQQENATDTGFNLHVAVEDPPQGETCSIAIPLALPQNGAGSVTVQGDTTPFFNELTPSCVATMPSAAPDVVYSFTTQQTMDLRLYIQSSTTGFQPTLSLRTDCGSATSDTQCVYVPSFATDAWIGYPDLPAGTWFVVVDGYQMTPESLLSGAYSLTASLSTYDPPGENCGNPDAVTLSSGDTGTATVTMNVANYFPDNLNDTLCAFNDGSDAVYSITTDQSRRLHVLAIPSASAVQPNLAFEKSPCGGAQSTVSCEQPAFDGTGRISADLPAGTSYLAVWTPLANPQGTVALSLAVDDFPPGDICSQALPLTFSNGGAGGTAMVTGNLFDFGADFTPSCGTSGLPDLFYSFTTSQTLNLAVTMTQDSPLATAALALLGGCGTPEMDCTPSDFAGDPLTLTSSSLPPGTYTLVVEGGQENPAGFTLSASLTP
jgi:hypothetical protein